MQYFDAEQGEELKLAFEDLVLDWPSVAAKTMFGCPSYRADDTIFAVLVTDGVVLTRLPSDERTQLEQLFDTAPFEASGRTVADWVTVPVDGGSALGALRPYLEASYETALAEVSD